MQINRLTIALTIITILFGLASFSNAEPSSPSDSESFVQLVKHKARLDAENGRPEASVQEINLLFGNEGMAQGFSLRATFSIYEQEYSRIKEGQSLWRKIKPEAGWILSAILLLCLLFKEFLQKTISNVLQTLQQELYSRLAGYTILRRTALRRYRNALSQSIANL